MDKSLEEYKYLPSVDKLLVFADITKLIDFYGRRTVVFAVRKALELFRESIKAGNASPDENTICLRVSEIIRTMVESSLKRVINTTGVIINTNLGRAPISRKTILEATEMLCGYSNLEFNLNTANRGQRSVHLKEILCFLTGAEDVLVVNNAAAAVLLCLNSFANRKEVIVSRSELVEIGGSFRIPEVMKAAGSKMIEVGTTNKTRIADFESAITEKTAILFKAHQSNFVIKGFTEEVGLGEMIILGKKYDLPVIYDNGAGLLSKSSFAALKNQSSVKTAIENGADLVCFSGDKLMGGPQAGIIVGKKKHIDKLKKNQLLRALRVCKTTIAILESTCRMYMNESELNKENYIFRSLSQTENQLYEKAANLCKILSEIGIKTEIVENEAMIGGGSSPENIVKSFAVKLTPELVNKKQKVEYAENLYRSLMICSTPIVGILRKGELLFDIISIESEDLQLIANAIKSLSIKDDFLPNV